jgi:hypothetical protein
MGNSSNFENSLEVNTLKEYFVFNNYFNLNKEDCSPSGADVKLPLLPQKCSSAKCGGVSTEVSVQVVGQVIKELLQKTICKTFAVFLQVVKLTMKISLHCIASASILAFFSYTTKNRIIEKIVEEKKRCILAEVNTLGIILSSPWFESSRTIRNNQLQ